MPEFSPPELIGYSVTRIGQRGLRIVRNDGAEGADMLLRLFAIAVLIGLAIFFWQLAEGERWYAKVLAAAAGGFLLWMSYLALRVPWRFYYEFYPDRIVTKIRVPGRKAETRIIPVRPPLVLRYTIWDGVRGGHTATLCVDSAENSEELLSFGSALNTTRALEQMDAFVEFLRRELGIDIEVTK